MASLAMRTLLVVCAFALTVLCNAGQVPVDKTRFQLAVHQIHRERTRLLTVQMELGTTKSEQYKRILQATVAKLNKNFEKMPISFWEQLFVHYEDPTNTLHDVLVRSYLQKRLAEFTDLTVGDDAVAPHYVAICPKLMGDKCRFIYADDTHHVPEIVAPKLYTQDNLRLWFPSRRGVNFKKIYINKKDVTEIFYSREPSRDNDEDEEELQRPPMQYWKTEGTVYTILFRRRGESLFYKISWYLKEKQ